MIVRALDANGDWTFGYGDNNYLESIAAVDQCIKTRLNSFVGNCFFDLNAGVDWFNLLGSKNQIGLELAISAVITNTPNVTAILELSAVLNHTTRALTITYSVTTAFSASALNGSTVVATTNSGN